MITSGQIRAARALLRWTAQDLADRSGVSLPTIQRMEAAQGAPRGLVGTLVSVKAALEAAGIVFVDAGVRLPGKLEGGGK